MFDSQQVNPADKLAEFPARVPVNTRATRDVPILNEVGLDQQKRRVRLPQNIEASKYA
jgi:hypothetical protein